MIAANPQSKRPTNESTSALVFYAAVVFSLGSGVTRK